MLAKRKYLLEEEARTIGMAVTYNNSAPKGKVIASLVHDLQQMRLVTVSHLQTGRLTHSISLTRYEICLLLQIRRYFYSGIVDKRATTTSPPRRCILPPIQAPRGLQLSIVPATV